MKAIPALLAASIGLLIGVSHVRSAIAQSSNDGVPTAPNIISGKVSGINGPEAGVWVIAETEDLPTRFIKIVVTDDQGRYVLPDLPKAKYSVWVRGYGLVDSPHMDAQPGNHLDLTAVQAPDAEAAAQYYPANYWLSLIHPPVAAAFPGTGAQGNGIPKLFHTQQDWFGQLKNGCHQCHQLGDAATREIADNSVHGWAQRILMSRPLGDPSVDDRGPGMSLNMQLQMRRLGGDRALQMFADWSKRIAAGETPAQPPPRPSGIERNLVLTLWDWADGSYIHDTISTDRRNPNVNAGGIVYGTLANLNYLATLNPKTNTVGTVPLPSVVGNPWPHNIDGGYPHSLMMDQKGRIWMSSLVGVFVPHPSKASFPAFCSSPTNAFAKNFPVSGPRHTAVVVYYPATKKSYVIPTCFNVQHMVFGKNNVLYFSGEQDTIGWIDVNTWDKTHDAQKSQGWCPMLLDTKAKGAPPTQRGDWNRLGGPIDPNKDTLVTTGLLYGLDVDLRNDAVWEAVFTPYVPSGVVRFQRGAHPPETCKTEYYEPPKLPNGNYVAFHTRGVAVDSKDIAWVPFTSGKLGRFDRSKCKVLTGPGTTGQQCPEGWTFYPAPGPTFPNTDVKTDWYYLSWVDLFNTLGLGKDVPIMPGSESDSLQAFIPSTGKFVTLTVPYPMGFFARGLDGRIDNSKAGWKGRSVWSQYSDIPVWHQEGGEDGSGPEVVEFQLRPNPLAY